MPYAKKYFLFCVALLAVLAFAARPANADDGRNWNKPLDTEIYSTASNGKIIAVGRRDNKLSVFDMQGNRQWEFQSQGTIYGVALSADGQAVAAASEDRHVYLLDGSGQERWNYKGPQTFNAVAITPDGAIVVAGGDDKQIIVLDRNGKLLWTAKANDIVTAVAIYGTADNFSVLAGSKDSRLRLLNKDGKEQWVQRLSYSIRGISVTPDGSKILVGDNGKGIKLVEGTKGKTLWTTNADSPLRAVAISPDGSIMAAAAQDGTGYVLKSDGSIAGKQSYGNVLYSIAVSTDGQALIFGSDTGITLVAQGVGGSFAVGGTSPLLGVIIALGVAAVAVILVALRRFGKLLWRHRVSYIFLLPTFILLLVFNYYPAASGIFHSFTAWNPGVETRWTGLQNFQTLANDKYLWVGVGNCILLIVTGFLKLTLPLFVAELIFHTRSMVLRYSLRTLFVIPLVVPGVVLILLWVNIYDPNIGLANEVLRGLGLNNLARTWFGEESTAMPAIAFMGFPWVSPFALLIFYGGLIGIPEELFDAAKVDGATWWRRFRHIDLPLLVGPIRILMILSFIGSVQEFAAVFLTTGGGPGSATYVPALELYYQAVKFSNFGLASAIGAGLFLVILGGTVLSLRYLRSSVEYGA